MMETAVEVEFPSPEGCHVNDTKRRIVEEFERRMAEDGYEGTTLDAVAAKLHISKKTIYVHFGGKRDIYASLVAEQARREKQRLAAAVADLPTAPERTAVILTLVLEAARQHISEVGVEEWMREYDVAADVFRAAYGELLAEAFEEGVRAGVFTDGDAVLVTRMVTALMVDYVVAVRENPTLDRDEEIVDRVMGFLGS